MPSESAGSVSTQPPTTLPDQLRSQAVDFRSRVALASEEVRDWRIHHESAVADPASVLAAELGSFADGRINPVRLAGLVGVEDAPDPVLHHLVTLAEDRFGRILSRDLGAFAVTVPSRGDLRDSVRDALAGLGAAFGLGRAVQKARSRRFDPDLDHELLRDWPFHRWSRSEKALAPPLSVDVEGADLRAAGLAEFLEGSVRLVLHVRGSSDPAPLARLVSPGVFVAQCTGDSAGVFDRLAAHDGPGVVALFDPEAGALDFVHDPSTGLEVDPTALAAEVEAASEARGHPGLTNLRHLQRFTVPATSGEESLPDGTEDRGTGDRVAVDARDRSGESASAGVPNDVDQLAGWLMSSLPADMGTD